METGWRGRLYLEKFDFATCHVLCISSTFNIRYKYLTAARALPCQWPDQVRPFAWVKWHVACGVWQKFLLFPHIYSPVNNSLSTCLWIYCLITRKTADKTSLTVYKSNISFTAHIQIDIELYICSIYICTIAHIINLTGSSSTCQLMLTKIVTELPTKFHISYGNS